MKVRTTNEPRLHAQTSDLGVNQPNSPAAIPIQDPALGEIGDSNVRKANTDYIIPGVPNEQLRFAALNGDSAIVFDEWGGYADQAATLFPFFK